MSNYDIYAVSEFGLLIATFPVLTHIASFDNILAILFL